MCRTVSTDAMQVLLGVPPLDLEVVRRATAYRIRRGVPLLQTDLVSFNQVEKLGPLAVKKVLDESVTSKWQLRWDECGKGRVTYKYVRYVSARGSSVVDFGLEMGFLLTGHGSLNEFLFKRNLASSQGCVLCGADSEDWFHVLSVRRTVTSAI